MLMPWSMCSCGWWWLIPVSQISVARRVRAWIETNRRGKEELCERA